MWKDVNAIYFNVHSRSTLSKTTETLGQDSRLIFEMVIHQIAYNLP